MFTNPAGYSTSTNWHVDFDKQDGMKLMSAELNSLHVLDLGCGPGDRTKHILNSYPSIKELIAVDVSKDMIEYAKKYNADEKIKYFVADIEDLSTIVPQWLGLFDVVFSLYTLQWIAQQKLALQNVRSLLVESGEIYFQFASFFLDFFYDAIDELLKIWDTFLPDGYEMPSIYNRKWNLQPWVSVNEPEKIYAKFMSTAGYIVEDIRSSKGGTVADKESFIYYFRMVFPPLAYIPVERHVEFLGNMFDIIVDLGYLNELKQSGSFISMYVHAKAAIP